MTARPRGGTPRGGGLGSSRLPARRGVTVGGVAVGGRSALGALAPRRRTASGPQGNLLDLQPSDSPIETVVVMMMENRSFDHYLGWLGTDDRYNERGRSRCGSKFTVDGKIDMTYVDAVGKHHQTHHLVRGGAEPHPFRGCGHPIPGHGWYAGRTQLAKLFLADGTGNDPYAIGYYLRDDVPVHAHLADRFTVHDRSFASLCAGTFPNRQYLYTAQSDGEREDPGPLKAGIFRTPTIFEKLLTAKVPLTTYHTDIPMLLLWGEQYRPFIQPLDDYFEACSTGTLPNVVAVTPSFRGDLRSDDHSQGDIRVGQRFIREVFNSRHQLRTRGLPGADHPRLAVRPAGLRRPPRLRPHLDPAVPGMALPRCPTRGPGRVGGLEPDAAGPQCQQHRRLAGRHPP